MHLSRFHGLFEQLSRLIIHMDTNNCAQMSLLFFDRDTNCNCVCWFVAKHDIATQKFMEDKIASHTKWRSSYKFKMHLKEKMG